MCRGAIMLNQLWSYSFFCLCAVYWCALNKMMRQGGRKQPEFVGVLQYKKRLIYNIYLLYRLGWMTKPMDSMQTHSRQISAFPSHRRDN